MTERVRLGVLRLTDSAPAVLAEAEGLFAAEGLDVVLQVEPSWANLADKLSWGKLEAAIMLPPLVLAAVAGLRGPPARLIVPMGISQGGNTIVVGREAAAGLATPLSAAAAAAALRAWLRDRRAPPRFAVVHAFSTHNMLLRHWLAAAGMDPDRDLDIVAIPPERVVDELAMGHIAGFCAGAPWGDVAETKRAGRILLGSSAIRPRHAEKCLSLAADWASRAPQAVAALTRALRAAQLLCDVRERGPALAALLAQRLGLPEIPTRAALPGGTATEHVTFQPAARLDMADGMWFLQDMQRWGWLPADANLWALLDQVYQPDMLLD